MGKEGSVHEYSRSGIDLNKATPEQTIRVKTRKAPICEAIFLPETGEMVGLTTTEYQLFTEIAGQYEAIIKAVQTANASGDRNAIARAKERLAEFMATEARKVQKNPAPRQPGIKPLHAHENQAFIEVVQFGGRKWRFMPRNLIDTFRRKSKVMPLTQAAKYAYNKHAKAKPLTTKDVTEDLPNLRTYGGRIKKGRIRRQFLKLKVNAKWELAEPVSGQARLSDIIESKWLRGLDDWVESLNRNIKLSYNDKQKRKEKLIELLRPKKKAKKKDHFDEASLGRVKAEVEDIWGESEVSRHARLVRTVHEIKWDDFDDRLDENRSRLAGRISQTDLPEIIFNASAEAQFMRYAGGVTAAAEFEPAKGRLSVKAEASANLALAEGKAKAQWLLPDDKGFEMKLPNNGGHFYVYRPVQTSIADTGSFETGKSFILPSTGEQLKNIAANWESNGLNKHQYVLTIIGHADDGTDKSNVDLGESRARAAFELMSFDYKAWYARFKNAEWGENEIKHMLVGIGVARFSTAPLTDDYWQQRILHWQKQRQAKPLPHPAPQYYGVEEKCKVLDIHQPVPALRADGRIGTASPAERQSLKLLIEDYMMAVMDGKFMLTEYFFDPAAMGRGNGDPASPKSGKVPANRRLTFKVLKRQSVKKKQSDDVIALGHMRINIELYLSGYVGANIMAAAELAINSHKGDGQIKGLRQGETARLNKKARRKSKRGRPSYKFDDGLKGTVSAFAGAQASAGLKGIAEWKAPDLSPVLKNPNPLVRPGRPYKACLAESTAKKWLIENGLYGKDFVELASMGYAVTGSLGVGLEGEFQVGFDPDKGKFLIKAHASGAVGLGFGGAFEFSVSARHVYIFIRFIHKQLNDHNFSFVDFFDEVAFKAYTAWSYEAFRRGDYLESGLMAVGAAGMKVMGVVTKLVRAWHDHVESNDIANELAKRVNDGKLSTLAFLLPEVKGRLLHQICHSEGWSFNEEKEEAIIKILQTLRSKAEYREVLEHMAIEQLPDRKHHDQRERVKTERIRSNKNRLWAFLDGREAGIYRKWLEDLPDVAPAID